MATVTSRRDPDSRGYFGEFGGRYVPETLVEPVEELERAYLEAREDPAFGAELDRLLKHYVGRPTPVYEAVPVPRAGYVWAPGFWGWEGSRHVWHAGNWMPERHGYHWVPDRWAQVHGGWHHEVGHWDHDMERHTWNR